MTSRSCSALGAIRMCTLFEYSEAPIAFYEIKGDLFDEEVGKSLSSRETLGTVH